MAKAKAKRARRAKGRTAVVRGPQENLPLGPANGEPLKGAVQRTPRMRYVEPPTARDGNPFFALRVPAEMLTAISKAATKAKMYRTEWARKVLARAAKFKLVVEVES